MILKNCSLVLFIFGLIAFPCITFCQPHTLTCADVRNGTFFVYIKDDGYRYVNTRNGDVQTEVNSKTRQTILWDVKWINDCTYTLKYASGAEDSPKAERDLLKKHVLFFEILNVTDDYYVFKSTFDKTSNPSILTDTCWIKQRRGLSNKPVNNPRIDSINKVKQSFIDSAKTKFAMLYVYRPLKVLGYDIDLTLLVNDQPVTMIKNNSTNSIKLLKEGPMKIRAKMVQKESVITINAKYGNNYFLRCEIIWGQKGGPLLTLMNEEEAKQHFDNIK